MNNALLQQRLLPWLLLFLIPIVFMIIWLVQPQYELRIPADPASTLQNPVHFWVVTFAGALAAIVGILLSQAAQRRQDPRALLIALALLSSALSLMIHALSTPNILVTGRNVGYFVAAPVGMVVAAGFGLASTATVTANWAQTIVRWRLLLLVGMLGFWLVFSLLSLYQLPPLAFIPSLDALSTPIFYCLVGQAPDPGFQFTTTALLGLALFGHGYTGLHFLRLYRERPTPVLLGFTLAFTLFALVTLHIGLARTWHLIWWQWHVLLLISYGLLAYSVVVQLVREGSTQPAFDSLYLEETLQRVRQEYTGALESLVMDFQERADNPDAAPNTTEYGPVGMQVAQRFGLSDGQVRVLERAAEALAHEREQIARQTALVAFGQSTRVIVPEDELLQRMFSLVDTAFNREHICVGLVQGGKIAWRCANSNVRAPTTPEDHALIRQVFQSNEPVLQEQILVLPLTVKDRMAGILYVSRERGSFADRDSWMLRSLASQLSIALENVRLYGQIDLLFRQYMPASVATTLLSDPSQAALGGAVRTITVLFADLRGFTSLSERRTPAELVELLNRYFSAATEVVLAQGGTIDKFMGDAMMALFNAPANQPDHALRAARAALAMQEVIAPIVAEAPDMPQFGIGLNTGEALVGNIGSEEIRNYTAIGDTVNLASRLQGRAQGGQVLLSASTYAVIEQRVVVEQLGGLRLKGKQDLVETYVLKGILESTHTPKAEQS